MQLSENKIQQMFMKSAQTDYNPFVTTHEALNWVARQNENVEVAVEKIKFSQMRDWFFDAGGNLRHRSGRFFSIEGLSVRTNYGKVAAWQQPIINQPEVGFLGIIAKEFDGVLYFLLQAKVEPGNINNVQLSPTLQATKSNYTQAHGGAKPTYLEYFQNASPDQVLLDQLQSEQGARFLKKRNRNIIIKINDNIEVKRNFLWLTLGQIKQLALYDNVVNMDTRTVISGIPLSFIADTTACRNMFGTAKLLKKGEPLHSLTEVLSWLTSLKCKYELETISMPLSKVAGWRLTDDAIEHEDSKYFKVIAAQVSINNREVVAWQQPLVEPVHAGLSAFVVRKIGGIYHFLVQGKVELGNFDILEMAPTVQCITDNYLGPNNTQPFVDYVLNASPEQILIDTMQSEEGGRFFREQNRNMIVEADANFPDGNLPDNYIWMTHDQLMIFLQFNNYLNIQARSLLSLISAQ